jgi:hypothetical protein
MKAPWVVEFLDLDLNLEWRDGHSVADVGKIRSIWSKSQADSNIPHLLLQA